MIHQTSLLCSQSVAVAVCRAGHTRREALQRAAAILQQGAVRLAGVILNQQSGPRADGYYYYTDYYGSGDDSGGMATPVADDSTSARGGEESRQSRERESAPAH